MASIYLLAARLCSHAHYFAAQHLATALERAACHFDDRARKSNAARWEAYWASRES